MAYRKGLPQGTPVGQGRGAIRSAMGNDPSYKYSLKDRMAARRADKKLGAAGSGVIPQSPDPTKTVAATGNILNQRKNLFKRMEQAGVAGIGKGMREDARRLGVSDSGFNKAAGNIAQNEIYTPKKEADSSPGGNNGKSNTDTNPPKQQTQKPKPKRKKKINPETGLPFGTLPRDGKKGGYVKNWRDFAIDRRR